ncbi:MAG TPA: heme exporter protein CcmB [Acidimicrobiales bacterium]|nr:heme exporter protein CcmB [Acidimicrobiales bacterium]
MLHDATLVAAKDLRIERRSHVTSRQVAPFALLVLVLFAFALDPDRGVLDRAAPGLFWLAVVFSAVLAVQRSVAVEATDRAGDALRLAGLDPAGIFLGKAAAVAAQLFVLEALLAFGIAVLYGTTLRAPLVLVAAAVLATIGLAAAGTAYAAVAGGLGARDTLLPLLLLPVVAPVLLGATRAWEASLQGVPGEALPWLELLAAFAVLYVALGIAGYGVLQEES